jgi:peptide chain release factor subunit 1
MSSEEKQLRKYEFKKALEELTDLKGRGTELISLYIPPDKMIYDVVQYLREEYSTSSNIKSKSTKKNVLGAIESIMSKLKYFKFPPETGLVFFVGHVQKRGDQTEMYSQIVEPPEPIQTFLYKCDSQFYTEPLMAQLKAKDVFGLIVIDRKEATIGFLNGTNIVTVTNEQSLVPSKHHQGGQSSRRYERLIEIAANEYFKKIGEIVNNTFMPIIRDMKGVFIGGPGSTKNFFNENSYMFNDITRKVVDLYDVGYTDETGLRELVEKASESVKDLEISREKDLVNRFMRELKKDDGGLGVYGEVEIAKALDRKALDLLLLSEGIRKRKYYYKCPSCQYEQEFSTRPDDNTCPKCGGSMEMEHEEDYITTLFKLAEESGASVEIISEESEEGSLLKKAFGGVAGILRYAPQASL